MGVNCTIGTTILQTKRGTITQIQIVSNKLEAETEEQQENSREKKD